MNAPYAESNNFESSKLHGKDHHVQFRISPFAEKVGAEVAALFNMPLSQYAKAVLYRDLGLVFEPIDRRGLSVAGGVGFEPTTTGLGGLRPVRTRRR